MGISPYIHRRFVDLLLRGVSLEKVQITNQHISDYENKKTDYITYDDGSNNSHRRCPDTGG